MLYYTIPYYSILYYSILFYTILYYTIQHHYIILYQDSRQAATRIAVPRTGIRKGCPTKKKGIGRQHLLYY